MLVKLPSTVRLGLGERAMVARSTAISPKFMANPFCHSKLSIRLQWKYGNFDRLAARAVIAAKRQHPEVRLTLLLPYHPAEREVIRSSGFDGSLYPPGMEEAPRRFAIPRANCWMVEHCTHLVAYVTHPASNAGKVVEWGRKLRKAVRIIL